jgi:hypothetical protein
MAVIAAADHEERTASTARRRASENAEYRDAVAELLRLMAAFSDSTERFLRLASTFRTDTRLMRTLPQAGDLDELFGERRTATYNATSSNPREWTADGRSLMTWVSRRPGVPMPTRLPIVVVRQLRARAKLRRVGQVWAWPIESREVGSFDYYPSRTDVTYVTEFGEICGSGRAATNESRVLTMLHIPLIAGLCRFTWQ